MSKRKETKKTIKAIKGLIKQEKAAGYTAAVPSQRAAIKSAKASLKKKPKPKTSSGNTGTARAAAKRKNKQEY